MKLGRTIVFVTSVEKTRAFYAAVTQLAPVEDLPDWCVFRFADGGELALHAIPAAYAPAIASPPKAREDATQKLVLIDADLDAALARATAAGGTIHKQFQTAARRACNVIDPEGNVIQLANA